MNLHLKTTNLKLTSALEDYIKQKLDRDLVRLLKNLEKKGAVELFVEIAKITSHHQKGNIFRAEADLCLPGRVLRVEAEEWDLRVAIDQVKDALSREIKEYKERQITDARKGARKLKAQIIGK